MEIKDNFYNIDNLIKHIEKQEMVINELSLRLERLEFVASVRELMQAVQQELYSMSADKMLSTLGFSPLALKAPSEQEVAAALDAYMVKCVGNATREHLDKVYQRIYVNPYNQFLMDEQEEIGN